jgi:aerobic-type carbon monoxide dehydrogenase small subunit (CoxS/CutS family)
MNISFTLNRKPTTINVPPKMVLLNILREILGLTGTKAGCEIGSCGACTVIVDGEMQNSCTYPASSLAGKTVLTIEGLSVPDGTPNDLQLAFLEHGAVQCGYCIPGMIMAGESLLASNPTPSRTEIRQALVGNLCRCTGYVQIVDAIDATAKQRANEKEVP